VFLPRQIVKCSDQDCCSPIRSDLKVVLPDGFFPPPYILRRSEKGLEIPEASNVQPSDSFPPLLVRQSLNLRPVAEGFPDQVPYDLYCPTVKDQLQGACFFFNMAMGSKNAFVIIFIVLRFGLQVAFVLNVDCILPPKQAQMRT